MVYSKCYYRIGIQAHAEHRTACRISRGFLKHSVARACQGLGTELEAISAANGYAEFLVNVPIELSARAFTEELKLFTSRWIQEESKVKSPSLDYWLPSSIVSVVSPEDRADATMDILSNKNLQTNTVSVSNDVNQPGDKTMPGSKAAYWHHLIMGTVRGSMKFPLKYSGELENSIHSVCSVHGIPEYKSAAMRNHIHLLFTVPDDMILASFIGTLRNQLEQWMNTQRHFRHFVGWHDDWIVYTVSQRRLIEEDNNLINQLYIHRNRSQANEMSFIYQRLDIPFIYQLK